MKKIILMMALFCIGSSAMASEKVVQGETAIKLANDLTSMSFLDSTYNKKGLISINVDGVSCAAVGGGQTVCVIKQGKTVQQVQDSDLMGLLQQSGIKGNNAVIVKAIRCRISGELQTDNPDMVGEFLPTDAACTITQ